MAVITGRELEELGFSPEVVTLAATLISGRRVAGDGRGLVPEDNLNTNTQANAGTRAGATDAEAGDLSVRNNGDRYDLDYHENHIPPSSRSTGHLLERHVGHSDADLIARSNGATHTTRWFFFVLK